MEPINTLLLQRGDIIRLLSIDECMNAVEKAFGLFAEGKLLPPEVVGIHTVNGGFHIKAGVQRLERAYFAAKINANFPGNPKQYGLPSIQGVIVLCDAINGQLLALMDSIQITIIRTGAATGIATKHLASDNATVVTICGCGNQGVISLLAIMKVRRIKTVYAFDIDPAQIKKVVKEFERRIKVIPVGANELSAALSQSQIVVTCTPSREPFIHAKDIQPGTFIAAVGADSEYKQELFSDLLASGKVVVDLARQCAAIGELHHAIRQGLMTVADIYTDLGSIIAGKKAGRESAAEIIIFDSTGTAFQDVAAAAIVYEKAIQRGIGKKLILAQQEPAYET